MSDLRSRLLRAFKMECPEHLEGIRTALATPAERFGEEEFYSIMRHAHTLKGAARAAGLPAVERAAHELESAFTLAREEEKPFDEGFLRTVHLLLDAIEAGLISGQLDTVGVPIFGSHRDAESPTQLQEEAAGQEYDQEPATVALPVAETAVRIHERVLDEILLGSGQVLSHEHQRQRETAQLLALQQGIGALRQDLARSPNGNGTKGYAEQSATQARVEELARLCGDLLREHRARSLQFRRVARQLYGAVSEARLVSADGILTGLGRMVREVAHSQNKSVRYVAIGLDTRVDRAVLQQLKEPILHTLRNAVHHGVETPDQRTAAGKSSTATVELELRVEQNSLIVRISDDGGGLRERAILEEARRRGLNGTLEEILTTPEFSTAASVSRIAGRGIGLAIVREALETLQGSLRIESRPGEGASFEYRVPVAMFSQLMVFVSSMGQLFALQSRGVEAMLRVPYDSLETVEGKARLSFRGQLLPIGSLSGLISQSYPMTRFGDTLSVVVLKHGQRRGAVVVDAFENCQQMMVRPTRAPGIPPDRFLGTVIREDGSVCLVLSVPPLLRQLSSGEPTLARMEPAYEEPLARDWPTSILVVDDSITTRTLEKSILETHGYHVLVAVDGYEALKTLEHNKVDLVISDVEMPNLDGFALLEKMKSDERLSTIPVILLTSRKEPEAQKKGLNLGAEAYLVKQDFDQLSLLEAVRQIV